MNKTVNLVILTAILELGIFTSTFAESNITTQNLQVTTQLNGYCKIRTESINLGELSKIPKDGTFEGNGITTAPSSKIEYLCSKNTIGTIKYSYSNPDYSSSIRPWGGGFLVGQVHGTKIPYTIDNISNLNINNVPIIGTGQWVLNS